MFSVLYRGFGQRQFSASEHVYEQFTDLPPVLFHERQTEHLLQSKLNTVSISI